MTTSPKLESYLTDLDRALSAIATSDRAEIVTEIKSHVLEAMERDPSQKVEAILASLGEPEQVASRYLLERGLSPKRPSKRSVVQWLVIGFLGTVGFIVLTFALLIWKFTPLLEVNDKEGQVKLLGGTLKIDSDDIHWNVKDDDGHVMWSDRNSRNTSGTRRFAAGEVTKILVPFSNGKLEVVTQAEPKLTWKCRHIGGGATPTVTIEKTAARLDLSQSGMVRCDLSVPRGVALEMEGANGKIELTRPDNPVTIDLSNGLVEIDPDPSKNYRYALKVTNGKIDEFTDSDAKDAWPIKVSMTNGKIERP